MTKHLYNFTTSLYRLRITCFTFTIISPKTYLSQFHRFHQNHFEWSQCPMALNWNWSPYLRLLHLHFKLIYASKTYLIRWPIPNILKVTIDSEVRNWSVISNNCKLIKFPYFEAHSKRTKINAANARKPLLGSGKYAISPLSCTCTSIKCHKTIHRRNVCSLRAIAISVSLCPF